jgi:hypothetical protein
LRAEAAAAEESELSDDNLSELAFPTIELGVSDSTKPIPSPASARKTRKGRKKAAKGKEKEAG